MSKGWIKLHRSMFDNDLWTAEPFTKGQAWIDLIGHANHRPASIWIRGIEVSVERGQLAWSELTMADRWKWSRGKVRRYLRMLQDRGMVVQQTNKVTTVLTICKYETYQTENTTGETTNRTTGRTTDGQQTDNRRYTNKNVKNGENKDKDIKPGPQQAEPEPAIGYIPTNKYNTEGEQYPVTQRQIDGWQEVYPAVNVIQEVKRAKAWLQANPSKAKTYRGMAKFLNGWMSRQQDRGGSVAGPANNSVPVPSHRNEMPRPDRPQRRQ